MLDKLRIVKQRYDEVSDLIIQPEVIMEQKRYAQLMKEYKDLGSVVEKGDEYQTLMNNIEEAKEILADGSDAEMNEMAKMEIDEANTRIPKLEDEITSFFLAHDDINIQGSFNRFHHLVQGEKLNIKNNARGWSTMYNRPMEPDDPQEEHIYQK